MTEATREHRLAARLHKAFPLYAFMAISVDALGETVRLSAPLSPQNTNHFGVVHAGVLFTLSEATAGLAVTQHPAFRDMTIIATDIEIHYRRAAKTDVSAKASLDAVAVDALSARLAADPKHTFEIATTVRDAAGVVVCEALCHFQLRARRA